MNKQVFTLYGVTEKDFEKWCEQNNKSKCHRSSQSEFFKKILLGQLAKDSNGNLVKKHRNK